jgi:hypothetical protein
MGCFVLSKCFKDSDHYLCIWKKKKKKKRRDGYQDMYIFQIYQVGWPQFEK